MSRLVERLARVKIYDFKCLQAGTPPKCSRGGEVVGVGYRTMTMRQVGSGEIKTLVLVVAVNT